MKLRSLSSPVKAIFFHVLIAGILSTSLTSISVAQEAELIIEAGESLQWLREQKQYIATGDASVEQGDLRLAANVIIANYQLENTDEDDHGASSVTFVEGRGNVKLTHTRLTATAHNITYDIIDEYIELKGDNSTIISENNRMSAEKLITYDRISRKIIAEGSVEVVLSNGRILMGDKITASLNSEDNEIETFTAKGNAVVINPSQVGKSSAEALEIFYTNATGTAILIGDVTLQDGNNILKGDHAEIDTINGISTIKSLTEGQRVGGIFSPTQ